MTIDDYLHEFQSRLTYVSEKEQTKIKYDIRSEIEQIKENLLEHEELDEEEAEHQAVASYLSPADMAQEINDQYFESIDEQFSGRSIAFIFVLSVILTPLGILIIPFVTGSFNGFSDQLIPRLVFMLIAALILFFYYPKHITSEQLRSLRQIFVVLYWYPVILVFAFVLNLFRSDGFSMNLTLYLAVSLFIWLLILFGTRIFYQKQLNKPL
ncbi:hypothetical protein [Salisediminibacterium selenitireducens]|uniref:Uncharacterized protein n=1 Tax=Bacillus selenitireducens (strain ATCC 700615 / DSM 15326 / MLS10) TaxID=439292 RepID=D6XV03_BACIE|nr:hypothetical protein [Salisediminibacterium selenitireducens]ADH97561.1 hypothetical protein Bsel_0009 [[Bacillus] selenitireducens MLS10]